MFVPFILCIKSKGWSASVGVIATSVLPVGIPVSDTALGSLASVSALERDTSSCCRK